MTQPSRASSPELIVSDLNVWLALKLGHIAVADSNMLLITGKILPSFPIIKKIITISSNKREEKLRSFHEKYSNQEFHYSFTAENAEK